MGFVLVAGVKRKDNGMSQPLQMSYPLRFVNGLPVMVEQDSAQEIAECVEVILRYPAGSCVDLPEFGIPDPTFAQNGLDLDVVRDVVEEWEPRAEAVLERDPRFLADALDAVTVTVKPTGAPRA